MKLIPTVKLVAGLALIGLTIILVLQNTETVDTRILWATITMPRAMLLALVALMGLGAGMLLSLLLAQRKKKSSS